MNDVVVKIPNPGPDIRCSKLVGRAHTNVSGRCLKRSVVKEGPWFLCHVHSSAGTQKRADAYAARQARRFPTSENKSPESEESA